MWKGRHIVSVNDFSKNDILEVLGSADAMLKRLESGSALDSCRGRILATLFFEPSTRTRLSFESAMQRLGGSVLGFSDPSATSVKKRETTADTVRTAAGYSDVIVMRHPNPGAAQLAAEVSPVPVINGGDGSNQHPTQTLLDLFTMRHELGGLDGLKVALVGDLKYGRTVHSLVKALGLFDCEFRFITPKALSMPDQFKKGVRFEEREDLDVSGVDAVYVTRIQEERFADPTDYEKVKGAYVVDGRVMDSMDGKSIVMHPLPRVGEIDWRVDDDPRCVYFKQAFYGVATRMALLSMVLGVDAE